MAFPFTVEEVTRTSGPRVEGENDDSVCVCVGFGILEEKPKLPWVDCNKTVL